MLILVGTSAVRSPESVQLTPEEKKLYALLNEYRKKNKLKAIPLSGSLSFVASEHVKDLVISKPHNDACNMHSWSANGKWSSCCYTPDHKEAACMWNKPRELTRYKGDGYEIVFIAENPADPNFEATAEMAIKGWKASKSHNEVMINKGIWKKVEWNAVGIAMRKGYACMWFGKEMDVK
jgi:uncharacterized protein YkwD